jgi:hypothetical protein
VKAFSSSFTNRLNAIFAAIGALLISAPDVLAQLLATVSSPEVQQVIALLPLKYKEIVDTVVRVLGALIMLFATLNVIVRVVKTKGPVAGPKIPFRGTGVGLIALLFAMPLLIGCASTRADFTFPDVGTIATPENADEVLWLGTTGYQFVVGSINALHDAGVFPDGQWQDLIARDNSPAEKVRDGLKRGFELSDAWRADGKREAFETAYRELVSQYDTLRWAWLSWRGRR